MLKILIREWLGGISLMKRPSPYSIVTTPEMIPLSVGCNEFQDLKYGFWLDSLMLSNIYKFIEKIDLSEYDTSNIVDMSLMFANCYYDIDLSKFDTRNVTNMCCMFGCSPKLVELDLSSFDTSKVEYVQYMFCGCSSLVRLDLSKFDAKSFQDYENMFIDCGKLTYIKCKRSFKEWCIKNQDEIGLPDSMREGGDGVWDIID